MSALLVAELRLRAAVLRRAAFDAESLTHALEGQASRARRNRKKVRDADLAYEYECLAADIEAKEKQ